VLEINATRRDELVVHGTTTRGAVRPGTAVDEHALRPVTRQMIGPYAAELDERRKSVPLHLVSMLPTLRSGVP